VARVRLELTSPATVVSKMSKARSGSPGHDYWLTNGPVMSRIWSWLA
jgi:hypothetical protein